MLCVLKTLAAGGNESEENEEMRKSSEDEYIKSIAQNKALEAIDTLCAAMYRETVGVERARRADVKMRQQRASSRFLDGRSGRRRESREGTDFTEIRIVSKQTEETIHRWIYRKPNRRYWSFKLLATSKQRQSHPHERGVREETYVFRYYIKRDICGISAKCSHR